MTKLTSGIDLNSNWGYRWKPSRASPCSDAYSGKTAFESYETKAMGEWLTNATSPRPGKERRVRAFVDLHSYGQLCKCTQQVRAQNSA
jgi:extracellular matrix protein 14